MAPETRSQVLRTRKIAKAIQERHLKFKEFMNGSFITFKRKPSQKRRKSRRMVEGDESDGHNDEIDSDDEEMEKRAAECYKGWSRRERKYYRDHEHHSLFWHMVLDWGLEPEHADNYFD